MAADPVTLSTELSSTAPAEDVLTQVRRLPLGSRVRFEQPDKETLLVSSGSKLRLRLLGAWLGSQHLPLKLRFELTPRKNGTLVLFTLTSDTGWHLVASGHERYRTRFEELVTAMAQSGIVRGF